MSLFNFIYIISYDSKIYYSIIIYSLLIIISSYLSMLFIPIIFFFIMFPLFNSYLISNTSNSNISYLQYEYLYLSLLLFIFLEILLFIAYFWFYYHNYSYSYYPINQHILLSSNLYIISGLILCLLSIYLSILLLSIFIILTSLEFNNSLDILYINDNPLSIIQLTIIFLHLLHLIVGILLILSELIYPYYYHFIEVIWLLIGYAIYLS
jgi:heme/copper-type cytochrome/quinol oxidase subunit 3